MQEFDCKANGTGPALPKTNNSLKRNCQLVKAMKLTVLILLTACLQVGARGFSQNITLALKDAPISKLFKAIEQQTDFTFFYDNHRLVEAKPITIDVKNVPLTQVLEMTFRDQPLKYLISGKTITVAAKKASASNELEYTSAPNKLIGIKGRITNNNGEPIPDATVSIQGTNRKTTTNGSGEFSFSDVDVAAIIVISHIQYEEQVIRLNGRAFLSAILQMKIGTLDEAQVVAYGSTTKRLNTGNVSTVKAQDIQNQPLNNPLIALQGRVPGLLITQANGIPGGQVTARIQGQNSINSGNEPFYVIDGVPYISQVLATTGIASVFGNSASPGGGSGSPFSFINAADIESITILKDADATAIYGSRAANGAILITTKKGKVGAAKISLNVQNGWGKIGKFVEQLNTQQYLQMRREAKANSNAAVSATDYDINGLWDTTRYTDWQKVLIGGIASFLNINSSISGGTEAVQYFLGGTVQKQTSVFPGSFADQKGTLHFNINSFSANRKFQAQLTGSYSYDKNTLPLTFISGVALTTSPLRYAPNAPAVYNADGTLNWAPTVAGVSSWTNPFAALKNPYESKTGNLVLNSILSYKILPNLTFKSSFGFNQLQINEFAGRYIESYAPERRANIARGADYRISTISTWLIEPQVNYVNKIARGNLDVLIGSTFQNVNSNGISLSGSGYSSDALMKDVRSAPTLTAGNSIASVYKYDALFGRVNYNWDNKYILNLTGRRDGSSRFGSENLFNSFWGVGASWIFSEEVFLKQSIPFMSIGKLRISYGTTGNDQIGDYQFMDLYSTSAVPIAYQGITALAPTKHANPNLQWEETKKLNIGLDLNFLNDRIVFSGNYVRNRSSNQLTSYPLTSQTGFVSVTKNFPANVQNREWQFLINTVNITSKSFNWSSSFNLTIPSNRLISFPDLEKSTYSNSLVIGQPVGILKAYRFLGVDQSTGLYNFLDKNGNVTSAPTTGDNTVLLNYSFPKYYGGFQNSLQYKNFQLDVLFQFVKQLGNNLFGGNSRPGNVNLNQPVSVLGRWNKPGDLEPIQKYISISTGSGANAFSAMRSSDAAFSDASFIRLKNVILSYQIPEKFVHAIKLNAVKFFVEGQNLMTITSFNGWDPESGNLYLPPFKMLTVGVNASL